MWTFGLFLCNISAMLKIRLQRVGRKHEPVFRLVLTDSQNSTKSGKFSEVLGSYDPRRDDEKLDAEAIKNWIEKGAQPTDTVHNLLIKNGIIKGEKKNVLPKKNPIVKEEVEASEKKVSFETKIAGETPNINEPVPVSSLDAQSPLEVTPEVPSEPSPVKPEEAQKVVVDTETPVKEVSVVKEPEASKENTTGEVK